MSNKLNILTSLKESYSIVHQKGFELVENTVDFLNVSTGVLKDIPFVSTAIALLAIKDEYQKIKLERNAIAFFQAIDDESLDKVKLTIDSIMSDSKKSNEFCEVVLEVLTCSVRELKARLLGGLVESLALEKISYKEFDHLALLICSSSVPSLKALTDFFTDTKGRSLTRVGGLNPIHPLEPLLYSLGVVSSSHNKVRISTLGIQLYKYGFKGKVED